MRLRLSHFIKNDLNEIGDFIARDNPSRAVTFVDELIDEISGLTKNALGYRVYEEIGPSARVATYGQYVILFRVIEDTVFR